MSRKGFLSGLMAIVLVPMQGPHAMSQAPGATSSAAPAAANVASQLVSSPTMKKLGDHYVEGAGYVTFFHKETKGYGGSYAECEKNCLADARCKMIEFYKPLRKCHLYNHVKWSGKSRDADVALKEGG